MGTLCYFWCLIGAFEKKELNLHKNRVSIIDSMQNLVFAGFDSLTGKTKKVISQNKRMLILRT